MTVVLESVLGDHRLVNERLDGHGLAVRLWERMEARDWDAVRALLAEDLVLEWPQSRERIRGPDSFIAVNRAYPGEWHIAIERVVAAGDEAVSR